MAWPGARRTYQQAAGRGPDYAREPAPPVPLAFPSGYTQLLGSGPNALAPDLVVAKAFGINLGASRLGEMRMGTMALGYPGTSTLPRTLQDSGLGPGALGLTLQRQYIPAWYGDSRIGRDPGGFAIGRGAIGYLRPYHGWLVPNRGHGIGSFLIGTDAIDPAARGYVELPPPLLIEPPFTHP